jgi:hypothetical protein
MNADQQRTLDTACVDELFDFLAHPIDQISGSWRR